MDHAPETPTEELPVIALPGVSVLGAARYMALVDAIRRHQRATGDLAVPKRPGDHALYRRLEELESGIDDEKG